MDYNIDYKELYNTSPCGYFCALPDGTIIDSNKRFLEFTNYKREEVIHIKKVSDFLSIGGKIYYQTIYAQKLNLTGTVNEINFDFIKKDGTKLPVLINSVEIKNKEGQHIFTQSTVFNISQRKKYETELLIAKKKSETLSNELILKNKELQIGSELILQQKLQLEKFNHQLENKNKQLSNFTHIASHNLRAPVSNLNSLMSFYNESTDIEDKAMLFTKFEIVIGHLTETLNELIESVKIQMDVNIKHDPVIFDEILSKTTQILEGKILESNAVITSNFSEAPNIEYPKLYLESIILNLLSNSIRYRSPNRIAKIHLATEIKNNEISLIVTDNGLGIDLKKHKHRLFKLNNTFHRHPDSKGVGLFMTKIQVETIGGSIDVESEVEKGTTFKIMLKKKI